jgi:hypothetical protein
MENQNRYQTEEVSKPTPEERLWKAILAQAIYDALFDTQITKNHERRAARDWFMYKTKNFVETCRNAGFDPDYVQEKIKKKILNQKMIYKMQKGQTKNQISKVIWNTKFGAKRER